MARPLATGGMAQVWEATDEVLARRVAVKILHSHLAADNSFVERFRREAVAAARLAHPSIVSIYDTCSEDGVEAIVMELVEGRTVRDLLDERGHLE
ncbi:MAG: eukaryotic-like serine/threonine-protein kinase, partial [Acidimicrobiaceae bacterium]